MAYSNFDRASSAPEVDPGKGLEPLRRHSEEGLEVVSLDESQSLQQNSLDSQLPIAIGTSHLDPKNIAPWTTVEECPIESPFEGKPRESPRKNWSRAKRSLIASLVFVVVLAIALGVGLGVGMKNSKSTALGSPSSSTPDDPNLPSIPSNHSILNDTSLAAVTTIDHNKHVFFQDVNGSLRHTIYDAGPNTWTSGANYVSTSSLPRGLTPLAAMEIYSLNKASSEYTPGQSYIHLFYVDTDNILTAAVVYSSTTSQNLPVPMNNTYSVAPGSRNLKVSPLQVPDNQGFFAEAMLTYESSDNNFTALKGHFQGSSGAPQWQWTDVTASVSSTLAQYGTSLSTPFTTSVLEGTDSKGDPTQDIALSFVNPAALTTNTVDLFQQLSFGNWSGSQPDSTMLELISMSLPNGTASSASASDLISYFPSSPNDTVTNGSASYTVADIGWVQDRQLVFALTDTTPDTDYPFSRLAMVNNSDGSRARVYHQITDTIIVEDLYDGNWTSTNVSVV